MTKEWHENRLKRRVSDTLTEGKVNLAIGFAIYFISKNQLMEVSKLLAAAHVIQNTTSWQFALILFSERKKRFANNN